MKGRKNSGVEAVFNLEFRFDFMCRITGVLSGEILPQNHGQLHLLVLE